LEDRPRPDRIPTAEINRLRELVEGRFIAFLIITNVSFIADHSRSIRSLANELGISHTSVKRHLKNFGIEHDSGFWVYPIRIEDLAQNSASTQEIRYPYNLPPPSTHSNYDWNLGWYSESSHQNY
jgi:DNA-binding transcriptional MocR family regulator